MKTLILAILPLVLTAQTTITPPQLRLGAPGEVQNLRLYAVGLSGMVQIAVGPGLKIDLVNGVPTLTVDPIPARITFEPMEIAVQVLTQDQNGNYVCPKCEKVFRNGIMQAPGVDYNRNSNGILPIQRWAQDDVVVGEWIRKKEEQPGPQAGIRPTVVPAAQIRNWQQVSPNDWLPRSDPRRRPGVGISQIERRTLWHDWTRPPDPPQLLVTISY